MNKKHGTLLALAIAIFWCCSIAGPSTGQASAIGRKDTPIYIGIAWPFSSKTDLFKNGIELAIADINRKGGVFGRPLEAIYKNDNSEVIVGKRIAQEFAEDPRVDMVIGHFDSFISLPTSIAYEYFGLLMLSPGSTDPKLTEQGFKRVFRTIPNDRKVGHQLAGVAQAQGFKKMVIIYEQSDYGRQLANAIEFRSEEIGIRIQDRLAYDPGIHDYRLIFAKLKLIDFDGIFFAGFGEDAQHMIVRARQEGFNVPVLGGNGLDTRHLFDEDPAAVEGTLVLSVFHIDNPNPYVQHFRARFQEVYGEEPDAWAAQGYDAMQILAHGIRHAQSLDPNRIAEALHSIESWYGVTGPHRFNETGDVMDKPMVLKIVKNGRLAFYTP